ncbi:ubiquitin carboxyl-terminal hydrolase 48-like [Littorina saxatilis]|uniref:Ubiquitin carboxyl-terminal hydrolase 48 n=1 Tax=Littorina saxatilis TaxID=31220 RepID=A0AAN9G3I1_9CAEN
MPAKVQQDKAAWQWADNIADPNDVSLQHLEIAYRCNLKPCARGECRRNCRGNPSCLNGLGERAWFKELDESRCQDFDPESERRDEGKFVGLKNLGATCYVNTFLQLWFHNAAVRRAVYQWQDIEQNNQEGREWKPSSVCGHLQLLFGLMQYSKRAYIDPSPLIECLGLDTGEQQDAQEFSKLFLSLLEGSLMQSSPGQPSNIVQQQFAGTYCYVTRCQACGSKSRREATFYELDVSIHGHSSLMSSLRDFLQEEKLEGENQYMCGVCDSKQNAVRFIQLQTMPPVLNLQLLRFVFDVKRGHKKKLNSYLQFGDVLDMSEFLQQPAMTTVYDLTAVLIHRGPSAYSGHYVAHIQDTPSKLWYRFNDEEIAAMKGSKLHLGKEEDIMPADLSELDEASRLKAQRCPKGVHSSRDAYMLVYSRRKQAETGQASEPQAPAENLEDLPAAVKAYVEKDNAKFEDWIQDIALTQDANMFSQKEKQMVVQSMYSDLFCTSSDTEFEWVPADWISSWLADPDSVKPISTAGYLCPHGRLRPDDVCKMKIVSSCGADRLYSEYGGDTRLKGQTALCMECVQQRCQEIQLKEKLAEHSRFLNTALKQPAHGEQCYWAGKGSLRNWKRYALQQTWTGNGADGVTDNSAEEEEETQSNGTGGDGVVKVMGQNGDGDCGEDAEDSSVLDDTFNSDLLCQQHGALNPDEGCRRLVSEAAWKRLRLLFPQCPQFHKDNPVCPECQSSLLKEQEVKAECRQRVAFQREQLQDLYMGRNRPVLTQLASSPVFALTATFLHAWRKLVKNREGGQLEPLSEIVNRPLLCEHDMLLYPVDLAGDCTSDQIVLVWATEWESLTQHYSFDVAIEVFTMQEDGGHLSVFTVPELCNGCVAQRLQEEEENLFSFEQATIFVRKVLPALPASVLDSQSPPEEDPDFVQTGPKAADCDHTVMAKKPRLDDGAVRKSQRHRKQRGEKEMKVSSGLTLRDFKIKVMNQFSIPTFDQNLSVDGRCVTDNSATLGQLHFYPGCVVTLRADEPIQDTVVGMDNSAARKREEGFKGTSLVSS